MQLSIDRLHARLGNKDVLRGVSLEVGSGELIGLIGPNGAGKSTLLRCMAGLIGISSGSIRVSGEPAAAMSARERARRIAYLPQEREIAWPVSVRNLVALGRSPHVRPFASAGPSDAAAVADAMRRMDIEAFASRPATDLSGGEKARVLIARALAQEAPLLLADEPTAGLDPAHQIALMRTFADLAEEGRSVIACLHDLGLAARWCTRLVLLDGGGIVADGASSQVLSAHRLREVYGVEAFFAQHGGRDVVQVVDIHERPQE